jgi:hypothetical protein
MRGVGSLSIVTVFAQAKVEYLGARGGRHRSRLLQHNVGGLQIAVDDPLLVSRVERVRYLARNRQGLHNRQWPSIKAFGERWAFDELEHKSRQAFGFLQPINRIDVRMIERASRRASRAKRERPSGSAAKCCGRILIATSSPNLMWRAR